MFTSDKQVFNKKIIVFNRSMRMLNENIKRSFKFVYVFIVEFFTWKLKMCLTSNVNKSTYRYKYCNQKLHYHMIHSYFSTLIPKTKTVVTTMVTISKINGSATEIHIPLFNLYLVPNI